mmetsp:Transcript_53305/g.111237  ORF Transcript_53305/g.111237 Transcript_53305/m.111237 type:complete len:81 (+) Transcript_53305:4348-4590(+)
MNLCMCLLVCIQLSAGACRVCMRVGSFTRLGAQDEVLIQFDSEHSVGHVKDDGPIESYRQGEEKKTRIKQRLSGNMRMDG